MNKLFKSPEGDVRWGWKAMLLIAGTILFGILLNLVVMTAVTAGYVSQGFARDQALEGASIASGSFIAQTIMTVLQMAFMLWLVRWLVVRIEKQKFNGSHLGLISADRGRYIRSGILLAAALSLLTIGIGYFAGTLNYEGNGFELFSPSQVLITLVLGAILACASGFGEEIAFRGYLQSRIAQRYHPAAAVVITAVLFALSHPVGNTPNPLLHLATAILVGILFGAIFVRTGSLWMGISLHAMWNFLQIVVFAIRNSADERFFGAPLLVFDRVPGTTQMLIELLAVLVGLAILLPGAWLPARQRMATNEE